VQLFHATLSTSDYLMQRVQTAVHPRKRVEVVNCGGEGVGVRYVNKEWHDFRIVINALANMGLLKGAATLVTSCYWDKRTVLIWNTIISINTIYSNINKGIHVTRNKRCPRIICGVGRLEGGEGVLLAPSLRLRLPRRLPCPVSLLLSLLSLLLGLLYFHLLRYCADALGL
jgi:hypothetical protein